MTVTMNGQKNTGTWSAVTAGYFCSLNGADSNRLFLKWLNILNKTQSGESRYRHINTCIYLKENIKYLKKIFIIMILFALTFGSYSQDFHTSSNKALKAYNEGSSAYDYFNFDVAESKFKEAISIDKGFYEPYMMLGELMSKLKRYSEAVYYYKSAVGIDSLFYKPIFFNLGNAEILTGDYSNAYIHYNVYLGQKGMSEKN